MSGVYIPGVEMPTCCAKCLLFGEYGCPFIGAVGTALTERRRNEDCPLISVPDHGDLIDRDIYRDSIRESLEECNKWANEVDNDTMMYARISQSVGTFVECSLRAKGMPTVIPADKEELYEITI